MRSFIKIGKLIFRVEDFKVAKAFRENENKTAVEIILENGDSYCVEEVSITDVYQLLSNYETYNPPTDANNLRESLNRIGELEDELETVLGIRDSYQNRLAELNNKVDGYKKENKQLRNEIESYREILGTLPPIDNRDVTKGIIALQNDLIEAIKKRNEYQQEKDHFHATVTMLQSEIAGLKIKLGKYENENENADMYLELQSRCTRYEQEINSLKGRLAESEAAHSASNSGNRDERLRLETELATQNKSLKLLEQEYMGRLREHEKSIANLRTQNRILATNHEKAVAQIYDYAEKLTNNLDKLRQLVIFTWQKAVGNNGGNPGQKYVDELIKRVFDI